MAATNIEIFAEIPGYPGRYISNMGRFKGVSGRINRPYMSVSGSPYVHVAPHYAPSVCYLVAQVFLPRPSDKMMYNVRHINGDRSDNRARNLVWSYERDLLPCREMLGVAQISGCGQILRKWNSAASAALELKFMRECIYNNIYGRARSTHGMRFMAMRHRTKKNRSWTSSAQ